MNSFVMEPAERVAKVLVKLVSSCSLLVVSLVFEISGHGIVGIIVCVIGIVFGMLPLAVWKTL